MSLKIEDGVLKRLQEYGNSVAIAKGDNYLSIAPLLSFDHELGIESLRGGIRLIHPDTGKHLTGYERNTERRHRVRRGWLGLKETKIPIQPAYAFYEDNPNIVVPIVPVQDLPEYMERGIVKIGIGCGYDLEMDHSNIAEISLNGDLQNPEERMSKMAVDLKKAGRRGVVTGIKPVMFVFIAYRDSGIRYLSDITDEDEGVSEVPYILRAFKSRKGIRGSVRGTLGSADNQIMAGLYSHGTDLLESGRNLSKPSSVKKVRLVRHSKENQKYVVVFYSGGCILVTEDVYYADRQFFDDFFGIVKDRIPAMRKINPEPFAEKYKGFFERFEKQEEELIKAGKIEE